MIIAAALGVLKQRALTIAVILPLFLAALFYLPNQWWSVFTAVLLLIAGDEWSRLARFDGTYRVGYLILLATLYAILIVTLPFARASWVFSLSVLFWCTAVPCWLRFKWNPTSSGWLVAGIIVLLPAWLAVARLQTDPLRLLTLLGVVWIADTVAFFSGKLFGRSKLAPVISPGKTWEGVAGGMVAVVLYAWLVGIAKGNYGVGAILTILFIAMTILSILGDLLESWLKRIAGVKDSGHLLPGHGGLLDRIDGVMAALPLAALFYLGGGA